MLFYTQKSRELWDIDKDELNADDEDAGWHNMCINY